ncbi:ribonuclease J [Aminicella lysinilytica]|uniref:Ribonuclease J n=1 Tax=Aminicella lysinilytica TaxID=433323 RepID=A0A4R6Q7P2_9FIRM|nr:ribonuclease J [Aminicella lysinilytica]
MRDFNSKKPDNPTPTPRRSGGSGNNNQNRPKPRVNNQGNGNGNNNNRGRNHNGNGHNQNNSNRRSVNHRNTNVKDIGAELGLTERKNVPMKKKLEKSERKPVKKAENIKIIPIGGLNEIGKNMTILEYKDQILVIDCGMSFPEDEMLGIDVVIPDFSYLVKNAKKVKGVVITHGHEDHIGGVPYLLKQINVPIYGTKLPLGLIKNKLDEHGLKGDLRPINAGDKFNVGEFKVEAIRTTHSIADAICLCIETPAARIFHTGDFKIDYTPVDGEPIDFAKLAELGKKGVDLMMADSTNVLRPGFTPSEKVVGETLDGIFREAKNRILIATFSSNVHRVQKIIELAAKYGRKFAVSGRSMENVVTLAVELGYLKIPPGSYVDLNKTKNIPDNELVIITTGSQGEPMSALSRMAADEHRNVKLKKGDMVILSSTPVPGNEKTVSNVVNKLYEKEVEVIYNDIADIHVSGHACQEDLKLMHSLIKPKFFMPVHGEHRHLVRHAKLAQELGMKKDNIFVLDNGDQLTVDRKKAIQFKNVVSAEDILVDGLGVGDVGNIVLRDRKLLSESGLIIVAAAVDRSNGTIVSGPEIVSRGFVYVKENEDLMDNMRKVAYDSIEKNLKGGFKDWSTIKNGVRDDMRKHIFSKTKRSPIILPIFLEA